MTAHSGTHPGEVHVRFDDFSPGGAHFALTDLVSTHTARRVQEVLPVLNAAETAADDGYWVAGFVAYEAAPAFDPGLPVARRDSADASAELPLAWFAVFRTRRLDQPKPVDLADDQQQWVLSDDREWHEHAVTSIQSAIAAGEFYQVNLTSRLTSHVADPSALYRRLAHAQRGAHHAYLHTGDSTIVSASPELFFRRTGSRIEVRPMKGTAPRGLWSSDDLDRAHKLRTSDKDRAENIMILDLLRNDLNRVAHPGAVTVEHICSLEQYPTVWQLTSSASAQVPNATSLARIFQALFPCGSVTGAPKRAAMSAIAELETAPRGVYCGAIGYLAPTQGDQPASAVFSVAIRTVTCDTTGRATYGSGGAITTDSHASQEWEELRAKTRILAGQRSVTALLETMRLEPSGRIHNLQRHLNRLIDSARYFQLPVTQADAAAALLDAVRGAPPQARVRLIVTAAGRISVDVEALEISAGSVRLGLARDPVHSGDVLLFHKHADRTRYDRARQTRPDADDVILFNENNEVTEASAATIAALTGGVWITPPLHCGLLPGVERERLLAQGTLIEQRLTVSDLWTVDALAVISSLRGWRPAHLIDKPQTTPPNAGRCPPWRPGLRGTKAVATPRSRTQTA